jgi:CRISPR/Cas system-associated endoribonuclease Cas2
MLIAIAGARPSRMVVVAYDISSPRRARDVRRVFDAVNHAKQYSVYEAMLNQGELRKVLTEVSACCDPSADLLAAWWPLDGMRLVWREEALKIEAQAGGFCGKPAKLQLNIGNFMLCYDISDATALRTVAAEIAAESAMVQRSVYWLRAPTARLAALLRRCAPHLATSDRLWAYPLGASRGLWCMGDETVTRSVLPIATYHW